MRTRSGSLNLEGLGIRGILLIVAIICFVAAAVGFDLGRISLTAVGLALFAAAFLFE